MVNPLLLVALTVTLDAAASDFLSQAMTSGALPMEASFAEFLGGARAPFLPEVARSADTQADQGPDTIALQGSSQDRMAASTRASAPAQPPAPVAVMEVSAASQGELQSTQTPQLSAGPPPVTFEITLVEASQPQIIRIFNLDEGTREIEITHIETNEPQIIRILNPDEGSREIVLPPAP